MRTEDGRLIRQCLSGDETAFGFLVDKYRKAVYASAYAKLGNFADAEDMAQEVFIKAYQNLRNLKYYDRFCSWLYAITANLCKNFLRAKSSRPDGEFVEDIEQEILDIPAVQAYQSQKAYEPFYEALEELPDIYREVLALYYLGGMKSPEISEFLGISQGTVKARLQRARANLKKEMLAMMTATFDEMRLQPSFTFRVVEAIKRTRIQSPPSKATLPLGVSAAAGLIVLLLSLSVPYSPLYPIGQLIGSALPSKVQVSEAGVIPVDTIEITQIVSLSIADGEFGQKPSLNPAEMFTSGGKWTEKAHMPTSRRALSTSVVDGIIYAIGDELAGAPILGSVDIW